MFKMKKIYKSISLILPLLMTFSSQAAEDSSAVSEGASQDYWVDFSDPVAIYSKAGIAAGNKGVNVFAAYGSYLAGEFKQKLTVEAKNDLDYYTVDYLVLNSSNDTGFLVETVWDRDWEDWNDVNKVAVGVIKKIPLPEKNITLYPKLKFGFLWSNDILDTTFIEADIAIRYTLNNAAWFGITPSYFYTMKGVDNKEWGITGDIGYQFVEGFGIAAHSNSDKEFWVDITFAF